MPNLDSFTSVATELPRDRWGRPLITPPEGGEPVAYQRVTTFVGSLEDTYHLGQWGKRMVALGMSRRRDLALAATAISDPSDRFEKKKLDEIAEQAMQAAQGGAAAITGTALHSWTERVDAGEDLSNVPEEYAADLAAYGELMARYFEVVAVEGFCVRDDLRVGGSYDRVLRFTAAGLNWHEAEHGSRLCYPDGTQVKVGDAVIGDLKTGNVDFGMGKIAMQLGTYANSLDYDHSLGTRTPLAGDPSKAWAVVVHLPAGSGQARLLWVNVAEGWRAASTIAPLVRDWRKVKGTELSKAFARASSTVKAAPGLPELISTAKSADQLRALYAANSLTWTPGLTALSKARIAELEASS